MTTTDPAAQEILKQDGLTPGQAAGTLLDELRRERVKSESRERFWFRMAFAFWITAAALLVLLLVFGSVPVSVGARTERTATSVGYASVRIGESPVPVTPPAEGKANVLPERDLLRDAQKSPPVVQAVFVDDSTGLFWVNALQAVCCALLGLLPVAVLGGLFSSLWLLLIRRQASQAVLTLTLAQLTEQVQALARERRS